MTAETMHELLYSSKYNEHLHLPDGYPKKFSDLIYDNTYCARAWCDAGVLAAIATVCPNAIVDHSSYIFHINGFWQMLAGSGDGKSPMWVFVKNTIKKVNKYINDDIDLENVNIQMQNEALTRQAPPGAVVEEIPPRGHKDLLFTQKFTPEFIKAKYSKTEMVDGIKQYVDYGGLFWKDECSRIYSQAARVEDGSTIAEDLSMWFEGELESNGTVGRGEQFNREIYLVWLSATTPDVTFRHWTRNYSGELLLKQGMLNRIWWIINPETRHRTPPSWGGYHDNVAMNINSYFSESLYNLYKYNVTGFEFSPEAQQKLWMYENSLNELHDEYKRDFYKELYCGYLSRQPTAANKLAALMCIGRNMDTLERQSEYCNEGHMLIVTEDDVDIAIAYTEFYWMNFKNVVQSWNQDFGLDKPMFHTKKQEQLVYCAVDMTDDNIMSLHEIVEKCTFFEGNLAAARKICSKLVKSKNLYSCEQGEVKCLSPEIIERHHLKGDNNYYIPYSTKPLDRWFLKHG